MADAGVSLAGPMQRSIGAGRFGAEQPPQTRTDAQGRFTLSGATGTNDAILVSSPLPFAQVVPAGDIAHEVLIRSPGPATLVVRFDIPGAKAWGDFSLHRLNAPNMKNVDLFATVKARNHGDPGSIQLPAGEYAFARVKEVATGASYSTRRCDQRRITLEPGKSLTVDVVRKDGQSLEGEVVLPSGAHPADAVVTISAAAAEGLREPDILRWSIPILDVTVAGYGGKWKSELIPPGEYFITAESYVSEPRNDQKYFRSGIPAPSFTGSVTVTVPKTGQVPPIRIEMKPYRPMPAATQPVAAPAKNESGSTQPADPSGSSAGEPSNLRPPETVDGNTPMVAVESHFATVPADVDKALRASYLTPQPLNAGTAAGGLDEKQCTALLTRLTPTHAPRLITFDHRQAYMRMDSPGITIDGKVVDDDGIPAKRVEVTPSISPDRKQVTLELNVSQRWLVTEWGRQIEETASASGEVILPDKGFVLLRIPVQRHRLRTTRAKNPRSAASQPWDVVREPIRERTPGKFVYVVIRATILDSYPTRQSNSSTPTLDSRSRPVVVRPGPRVESAPTPPATQARRRES